MGLLKRRTIDSSIEEKILTGMIVSDSFCRDISKIINKDTFSVPFIARVAVWCKDYHKRYKQAPGIHISDIFEIEKEKIDEPDQKAISTLLAKLSADHQSEEFNEEYLKDRAFEHFRERNLKQAITKASSLSELGRTSEAEKVMESYKRASILTSGWEDPFDIDVMKNYFADQTAKKDIIFQLPGEIGRFIGPFQRNWLVGFLAPTKRGKSWWLIELAIQAMLHRKKVIFISLEMNSSRVFGRMYNRLTSMSNETKDYIFPCFDCKKNQENNCNKSIRTNIVRLLNPEGEKPQYNREFGYRPCVVCRNKKDFVPETWFTNVKKEKMKFSQAVKLIRSQVSHFGSSLKIKSYPAGSTNLSRVMDDVHGLYDMDGFVPDLIVIDYADILAPEDARMIGRERTDQTWQTLKRVGDELHCCVASASQANRQSFDKKNVTQIDTSEDIRKIAHGDLWLAINQTPQEKRSSISRISKIAMRDEDFDQYASVIVLQQLALGQVLLDSCYDKERFIDWGEGISL
jgi:replicative DNA helicase